jgi:NAD(P)H-flavin reductase
MVVENKGRGSEALSAARRRRSRARPSGPLGNGFFFIPSGRVLVVGGGIGVVPPLLYAAMRAQEADPILGSVPLTGTF